MKALAVTATAWRAPRVPLPPLPLAALLVAACLAPPAGAWLEASMARHMLVQYPVLVFAGVLAAHALPLRAALRMRRATPGGVAPLTLALVLSAAAMVPRVLDAAVASAGADALKGAMLVGAGFAGAIGWRAAGRVGQAFLVGNAAWMTATVGVLLAETPSRVCAQYLEGDQWRTGWGLVAWAVLGGGGWLATAARRRPFAGSARAG